MIVSDVGLCGAGLGAIMAVRKNESMGFVDVALSDLGGPRSAALLEKLDAATPWAQLAAPIAALLEYHNPGAGRRPWDPVLMLKCLMLATWNNLSDPGLEEALRDRISFRRFVGLSFTDATPDETTFVRFRQRLREAGLHDVIFHAVVEHINRQGLLVREGTMVDATIIEAPRGRPRPDGTRDTDASFTSTHGVPHHGYKGHIGVDLSGIVIRCAFGTARQHDADHFEDLIRGEDRLVLADSAYSSGARREHLRSRDVIDGICYKRNRGQKNLYDWQERWNRLVSRSRARVEHPTGMLKHQMGLRRVRYRGMQRNAFDIILTLTACNLKRSIHLRAA